MIVNNKDKLIFLTKLLLINLVLISGCSKTSTVPQDDEFDIQEIGRIDVGTAYDVYAEGNLASVTCNGKVVFIDVNDPENPVIQGEVPIAMAFGVIMKNDTAFIAGERFLIVNLSNPLVPEIIGDFTGGNPVISVAVQGNYGYLAYYDGGLEIVDIANPSQPQSVGYLNVNGNVLDVYILGNIVYLASSSLGLLVIDVSDPGAPRLISTIAGTLAAWSIHIEQNNLFLGCHGNGIRIIDIANPSSPTIITNYSINGEAYGVHGSGDRLYIADLQEGIKVLDIRNPIQPQLLFQNSEYAPHSIFYSGMTVYLGDQNDGFVILEVSENN